MTSKQRLLKVALKQGLLHAVALHCKDNALKIHSHGKVSETANALVVRWDGKVAQLTSAKPARLRDLHYMYTHVQPDPDQSLIVQNDTWRGGVLPAAFVSVWCYWVAENQGRLLLEHRVCTVQTKSGPIALCRFSVAHLSQLVNGLYWCHRQWKHRLRYLCLALDCGAPIAEAVLRSQRVEAAAFQVVELLLTHGFRWSDTLTMLQRGNDHFVRQRGFLLATVAGRTTVYPLDATTMPLLEIKRAIE